MDDASGVASVLEIARSFSRNRERPKRSMLFVIFTGEEKGLLGSRYFAGRPTVPETAIVADLNMDMFMPMFPLKKLHVQGLAESTLAAGSAGRGRAARHRDRGRPGARSQFLHPHRSIQLRAGRRSGAGDEVRLDGRARPSTRRGGNGWRSATTRRKTICRSRWIPRPRRSSIPSWPIWRAAWPITPAVRITKRRASFTASKSRPPGCRLAIANRW